MCIPSRRGESAYDAIAMLMSRFSPDSTRQKVVPSGATRAEAQRIDLMTPAYDVRTGK